jgi:hypothetical protein
MQDEVSLCGLGTLPFSLAIGCGSGGKTDVNLKAGEVTSKIEFLLIASIYAIIIFAIY